jgi:DNA-binding NarL/FixJ family response regulator
MRVLLADDQDELRSALRLVLQQESDMELVGEVTDVPSLMAEVSALLPDLLLLDWELPEIKPPDSGRKLISALHARHPHLRIIVLSGRPESNRSALASGANLFVSKTEPPERLLAALRTELRTVNHDHGAT